MDIIDVMEKSGIEFLQTEASDLKLLASAVKKHGVGIAYELYLRQMLIDADFTMIDGSRSRLICTNNNWLINKYMQAVNVGKSVRYNIGKGSPRPKDSILTFDVLAAQPKTITLFKKDKHGRKIALPPPLMHKILVLSEDKIAQLDKYLTKIIDARKNKNTRQNII